jgi:predicted house-cleaning noncanonical NTP pyrophosphatase (MazG superfamily)
MPVVYRKLVRDRIPEVIQSEGRRPVTRVLDDAS